MMQIKIKEGTETERWLEAKRQGRLVVEEWATFCPYCSRWVVEEQLRIEGTFQEFPKVGQSGGIAVLTCGTCQAKEYLYFGKGDIPFLGGQDKIKAWIRVKTEKRIWIKARIVGPWDGKRVLRNDKENEKNQFIKPVRRAGGFNVPEDMQERWGWATPAAAARSQHQDSKTRMGYKHNEGTND